MKPEIDHKRHIVKAITWRFVASVTTFLIGWIITDDITIGLKFGAADVLIKLTLYYLHERVWYKSNFGIKREDQ